MVTSGQPCCGRSGRFDMGDGAHGRAVVLSFGALSLRPAHEKVLCSHFRHNHCNCHDLRLVNHVFCHLEPSEFIPAQGLLQFEVAECLFPTSQVAECRCSTLSRYMNQGVVRVFQNIARSDAGEIRVAILFAICEFDCQINRAIARLCYQHVYVYNADPTNPAVFPSH